MSGRVGGAPPLGRGLLRVALALAVAYVGLGLGLSYWQVIQADRLTSDPADPLVIAAARNAPRGRILDARGVVLAESVPGPDGLQRRYPQPLAAPFIGYQSARFGTAGLERAYDAALAGLPGTSPLDLLLRKATGDAYDPADLHLSIDMRLQTKAMQLLGSRPGAIVAIEPSTGRVLALASSPTFDPNRIVDAVGGPAYFAALQKGPASASPLLDRATQGRFTPGSVFKIVTAIAGLGSGAITPQTTFPDQPGEEAKGFLVDGFRVIDGHHAFTDGTALDLTQATEVSCNIYYAHVGLKVGAAGMVDWAARLGIGAPIPFDLPTAASQVTGGGGPDHGFQDAVEVANAAYGQAETFVTPLQMALVAATVANGGVLMRPSLVDRLSDASGDVQQHAPQVWRRVLDPADDAALATAMEQAVEGTWGRYFAGAAAIPGVDTAGKSGTAQLGGSGEPHSWFIGFAPVSQPRIAVAVVFQQGGHGADLAVPAGGQLMRTYLSLAGS